ncbi:hypothetical protein Scep_024565 [Stephania cephalantha]|uniref:Pectinesterase n=1 Tax=Stephania cephalantha TaxID=152367 RepID=A0AAP0EZJ0_9MAGN
MASSSLGVVSSVFMLCFALFSATAQAQLSPNATSNATRDYRYITWQDSEFGIEATRDTDGHGARVIYVAKNGHGHSTTVQGAVDMVPDNNQDRVKIVIFPGTYKFGFLFITTDCVLHSTTKRSGGIAAFRRNKDDSTGFSFVNCTISGSGRYSLPKLKIEEEDHGIAKGCHMRKDSILHKHSLSSWIQSLLMERRGYN